MQARKIRRTNGFHFEGGLMAYLPQIRSKSLSLAAFAFKLGLKTGGLIPWKIQNSLNVRAKFRRLLKPNIITPGMITNGTAAGG